MDADLEVSQADIDHLYAAAVRLEESGDLEGAQSLYKIGISLGDLYCVTRLADVLSEPPAYLNVPLAEQLYLRACAAGDDAGCRNLAILYKQLGKSVLYERYMKLAKARGDEWQEEGDDENENED